jgi:hypothetical protein
MLEAAAFPYTRTTYSSTTHHPKLLGIKQYQIETHFHTHEHHIPVQHIIPTLWGLKQNQVEFAQINLHSTVMCVLIKPAKKEQEISILQDHKLLKHFPPLYPNDIRSPKNDKHPICKPVGFQWPARTLVHRTLFEHSGKKKNVTTAPPSFL